MNCPTCNAKVPSLAQRKRRVNSELYQVGLTYYDSLPMAPVDSILTSHGFASLEHGLYCGNEGRINEPVGDNTYLTMTWYRMSSGRFEIVAYVN